MLLRQDQQCYVCWKTEAGAPSMYFLAGTGARSRTLSSSVEAYLVFERMRLF